MGCLMIGMPIVGAADIDDGSSSAPATFCMFAACTLWTMIYDTIYAHQDLADDRKAGIKSLARQVVEPFAIGPRACLGQRLAWAEMQLILAKLVWMFDFGAIDGECVRWEDLRTYLLVERKPMNVRISLRTVG
ncbi:uncharacterized protein BDW70DRAFT_164893 [Aspergillus foveolatus]|uniref:uncharacterized protein n=1 Tax=Aspergillus foveolatus TaxID=210207 RepID=UPI003CCDA1E2